MSKKTNESPDGIHPTVGMAHRRSQFSVAQTVDRLAEAIRGAGAKLFVLVDHSGEAEGVHQSLRDTKLLIFGNPAAGTPVMVGSPLAALDLPLKVLVWQDNEGEVWMSYLEAEWLVERHGIPAVTAKALSAAEAIVNRVAAS